MKSKLLKACTGFFAVLLVLLAVTVAACSVNTEQPSEPASDPSKGNDKYYYVGNTPALATDTALKGKTIYWLGSSVTFGQPDNTVNGGASSMAEYIAKRNSMTSVKEAMSGTTLHNTPDAKTQTSYVARLTQEGCPFDKNAKIDAFVCQISTNDAKTEELEYWGEATADDVKDISSFDVNTTMGAIEYIIAYVRQTWDCPVIFYSGGYYENTSNLYFEGQHPRSENYSALVDRVLALREKWGIHVIDLFNNAEFNNVSAENYKFWMVDCIHPKLAGYLQWWVPQFEQELTQILE